MRCVTFDDYFQREYFPVTATVMPASEVIPNEVHTHDFAEIVLVESGTVIHCSERGTARLERGDFLLIHPGTSHGYADSTEELVLHNLLYDQRVPIPMLTATNLPLLREVYPSPSEVCEDCRIFKVAGDDFELILTELKQIRTETASRRPGHHIVIAALFMNIVIRLARSCPGDAGGNERWNLTQAVAFLKMHYREKIRSSDLARISHMSESTLLRRFKAAFGLSPMQYLHELRINYAASLLESHEFKRETIARECGFCDSSHLWKALRKHDGMS